MSDDLRIRLEGGLELIEAELAALNALAALARHAPRAGLGQLEAAAATWRTAHEALELARPRLHPMAEAAPLLVRVEAAAHELLAGLRAAFPRTALGRCTELPLALETWAQLLRTAGLPVHGAVLAQCEERPGPWELGVGLGGAILVLALGHGVLALVCVALAIVWTVVTPRRRYRLTSEALAVEEERGPAWVVPVDSIEGDRWAPGDTVMGLRNLKLPQDPAAAPLIAALQSLQQERRELEREKLRAAALPQGEAPLWCAARCTAEGRRANTHVEQRGPVEVVRFGGGAGSATHQGQAMVCERGVLFFPHRLEAPVREAILGTPSLVVFRDRHVRLESLSSAAMLQHLDAVLAVEGTRWIDWKKDTPTAEASPGLETLKVKGLTFSLSVDDSQREHLRRLQQLAVNS